MISKVSCISVLAVGLGSAATLHRPVLDVITSSSSSISIAAVYDDDYYDDTIIIMIINICYTINQNNQNLNIGQNFDLVRTLNISQISNLIIKVKTDGVL